MEGLPPCGLYRTTVPIGPVPAGRLVFFHNHGEPGPGIYLPESWHLNHARFARRGTVVAEPALAATLEPLPAEGLYRVVEGFTCCPRGCRTYAPDTLVQLGYNAAAQPILFLPEWTPGGLAMPTLGHVLDPAHLTRLRRLVVAGRATADGERILH